MKFSPAFLFLLCLAGSILPAAADPVPERTSIIVATGAGGEDKFATTFAQWADNWEQAGKLAEAQVVMLKPEQNDARARLQKALEAEPKESAAPLWIVLLGHGTFDGREGKFNLPGDDLSTSDLALWLKPFSRPIVVVCGFSASGPFLKPLSGPDRVIITSTRTGTENNYARLGGYLSETIASTAADLDKDGQTSLLEAWLAAAQRTAEFYKNEERMVTEHTLLDDNGDGSGTPPDWFQGVRVAKKSADARTPDGLRAHQIHLVPSTAEKSLPPAARKERDQVEREIAQLKESKANKPEDQYYAELEALLLRLAAIYRDGGVDKPTTPATQP